MMGEKAQFNVYRARAHLAHKIALSHSRTGQVMEPGAALFTTERGTD